MALRTRCRPWLLQAGYTTEPLIDYAPMDYSKFTFDIDMTLHQVLVCQHFDCACVRRYSPDS